MSTASHLKAEGFPRLLLEKCLVASGSDTSQATLPAVCANHVEHKEHYRQIAQEYRGTQCSHAAHKFAHLQGHEQGARNQGYPFGPGATVPQAIGFGEAQPGISKG